MRLYGRGSVDKGTHCHPSGVVQLGCGTVYASDPDPGPTLDLINDVIWPEDARNTLSFAHLRPKGVHSSSSFRRWRSRRPSSGESGGSSRMSRGNSPTYLHSGSSSASARTSNGLHRGRADSSRLQTC